MTATIWGHQSSAQALGQIARWTDHLCRVAVFVPTPSAFRAVARIQSGCSCELIPQQPDHEFPLALALTRPVRCSTPIRSLSSRAAFSRRASRCRWLLPCALAAAAKPHCSWDYRIERPRVMSLSSRKVSTTPRQSVLTESCLTFFANTEDTSTCPGVAFSG